MATKPSFLKSPSAAGTHVSSELTALLSDDIVLGRGQSDVTSTQSQFQVKNQKQQMDF